MIEDANVRMPEPAPAAPEGDLAHGLTFFFSVRERRAVLAQLRRLSGGRLKKEEALIRALGVDAQLGTDPRPDENREHQRPV